MSITLKILMVGPAQAGKSTIVNRLHDPTNEAFANPANDYIPTKGVRILENDKQTSQGRVQVELWDVAGNQAYEGCWPAILKDVDGVILVYNPENRSHEHEAGLWFEWFVLNPGLKPEQCLVLAHSPSGKAYPSARLPKAFRTVSTSMESMGLIQEEFDDYLDGVSSFVTSNRK